MEDEDNGAGAKIPADLEYSKEEEELIPKVREELKTILAGGTSALFSQDSTEAESFKTELEIAYINQLTDELILRFIKGNNSDLSKILSAIAKAAKYEGAIQSKANFEKWDSEMEDPVVLALKGYWPVSHIGKDFRGRLVGCHLLTNIDFPLLISELGMEPVFRFNLYVMERNRRRIPQGLAIQITDLGTASKNPAIDSMFSVTTWVNNLMAYLKQMSNANEYLYPEAYAKILLTRPPAIFAGVWSMIRPFLPERTKNKIIVLGKEDAYKYLKEYVSDDVIPDFLGGKNSCEVLGIGGKLPKNFMQNKELQTILAERARNQVLLAEKIMNS